MSIDGTRSRREVEGEDGGVFDRVPGRGPFDRAGDLPAFCRLTLSAFTLSGMLVTLPTCRRLGIARGMVEIKLYLEEFLIRWYCLLF